MDELLRQGGVHSCPPPRAPSVDATDSGPLTVIYASLHGGVCATYGQPEAIPAPGDYRYAMEGAPHTLAFVPVKPGVRASWMPRSRILTSPPGSRPSVFTGDKSLVEAHVNSGVGVGDTVELKLYLNRIGGGAGYISLLVEFALGKVTMFSGTVGSTGWVWSQTWNELRALKGVWHVGMLFDPTPADDGKDKLVLKAFLTGPDGTRLETPDVAYTAAGSAQPPSELNRLELTTSMATEALQLTTRLANDFGMEQFAAQSRQAKAVELDEPILPLYVIPRVSGSQWEAISEIAKTTMSTAEFDEQGVFRWRGFRRFEKAPAAADVTVTSRREISALTVSEEIDACRNYCEPLPGLDGFRPGTRQGDPAARHHPQCGPRKHQGGQLPDSRRGVRDRPAGDVRRQRTRTGRQQGAFRGRLRRRGGGHGGQGGRAGHLAS
ncbi:hypothetical protein ACSNOK_15565 [Streptomyces sp. URMC 126]|uniref:hypothetical protein n=1 Tax=Streptomyces sp. URMC 126 TaxID=3423401 RepID=UPI003F1E352E